MTAKATTRVTSAPRQVNSIIDYSRFRSFLEGATDHETDMRTAAEWENVSRGQALSDASSFTCTYLEDAAGSVANFIQYLLSDPIDTTDMTVWLGAWDALVGANRLAMVPHFKSAQGCTVKELLTAMAWGLDVVARLADTEARESWIASDDVRRNYGRLAPIYLDLVCGRGSAWLFYVGVNAVVAGTLCGIDWFPLKEAYAATRVEECSWALARTGNFTDSADVLSAYYVQASLFSRWFDGYQAELFNGDAVMRGMALNNAFRTEPSGQIAHQLSRLLDDGGEGWCGLFGLDSDVCTISAPRLIIDKIGELRSVESRAA